MNTFETRCEAVGTKKTDLLHLRSVFPRSHRKRYNVCASSPAARRLAQPLKCTGRESDTPAQELAELRPLCDPRHEELFSFAHHRSFCASHKGDLMPHYTPLSAKQQTLSQVLSDFLSDTFPETTMNRNEHQGRKVA